MASVTAYGFAPREYLAGATEIGSYIAASLERARGGAIMQWNNPIVTSTRAFVIDGVLPDALALQIHAAFPADAAGFRRLDTFRERKHTRNDLADLPPILSATVAAFQGAAIIDRVARIISLAGLEPDPSLYAGGLSMMRRGDFLNPHIDNSHDGAWRRYRRLNLLYYVTPGWQTSAGGHLELWDERVQRPVAIETRFNRLVVMETNRTSWHSVRPIAADRSRCCVSCYFFSASPPGDGGDYFHVTSFTGRPGQWFRRGLAGIDNRARGAARRLIGRQRGR